MNHLWTRTLSLMFAASSTLLSMTIIAADQSTGKDSASTPSTSDALDEITVTAQKSEQSLQKAALQVTAVTGVDLVNAGVQDLQDVQKFAPSVRFQEEGVMRQIYLRGIGSTNDIATEDPPNSYNFNGVYQPREATGSTLFDIADVEVLPGPQSTLYGRSSLGGTVNVTAQKPVGHFETAGVVELGDFNLTHVTGVINVPMTDVLWVRAAGDKLSHDGYETSGAYDRAEYGGRLGLIYVPSDALSIYLWGQYDRQGGHGANLVNKGLDPATGLPSENAFLQRDPWNDTIPQQYNPFAPVQTYPRAYHTSVIGGEMNYRFGGLTLTYIPSYTQVHMDNRYTFGAIPLIQLNESNQVTNELRLSSDQHDVFKWLVGAYQYKFYTHGHLYAFAPEAANDLYNDPHSKTHGEALFGQVTYSITDALRATVGGRLSTDYRNAYGSETANPYDSSKTFNSGDWKVGLEYDLSAGSLVYANVQTGSQVGTFNTRPATPDNDNLVRAPHLTSFSVGSKNRFFDDRIEINDETFYYNYRDFIVSAFDAGGGSLTYNASRMKIYGNDLTARAKFTTYDLLSVTLGWSHARYTDFITPFAVPGSDQTNFDGVQAQYSPNWSVSAGLQHTLPLGSFGSLIGSVDSHYESSYAASFYHPFGGTQSPYTKTDASLTYRPDSGSWSFAVWAKNLENAAVEEATATGSVPGPVGTFLAPPRTFGVRATYNFSR